MEQFSDDERKANRERFPLCSCGGRMDCCGCRSPIPNGGTCESACAHVRRCMMIFGQKPDDKVCQFIPSRYLPRTP